MSEIAEVLAEHWDMNTGAPGEWFCDCGYPLGDGTGDLEARLRSHVAEVVTGLLASPALADLLAAERQRGREEALREAAVTVRALTEVGDLTREPWDNGYRCAVRDALRDINAALADVPAAAEGDE